tara:strand:+ start:564 stop:830 length:267 start_codon:yes stop_codon:yes gene_type:complete
MSANPQQLHSSSATEKFFVSIIIEIPPTILIKKRLVITGLTQRDIDKIAIIKSMITRINKKSFMTFLLGQLRAVYKMPYTAHRLNCCP